MSGKKNSEPQARTRRRTASEHGHSCPTSGGLKRQPSVDGLHDLARQLVEVKHRAHALGIFTDDRELLECPNCGLLEASVVKKFFTTAADGKNNFTRFDNRGGKS